MSSTRAHHRRAQRADRGPKLEFQPDDDMGVLVAWCEDDLLEDCKKQAHDALIQMMGDRRTGGVQWLIFKAPACYRILDNMIGSERAMNRSDCSELVAHYQKIRLLLSEHGGSMVVTMAPGEPPKSGHPTS